MELRPSFAPLILFSSLNLCDIKHMYFLYLPG
jgi:hypothetical protein